MIALLCNIINLSIGAGDFLYLATLSLVYTLEDILWIVQIASLLGLFMSFSCQTKRLPFLPFLTIGLFIIMNN
ncbi:type IV prepilin peptidase PilD / late competence protein ComC processing protease [Streptococcus parauberis KRS-02109]|nr:type IV prepilin peptidase PilD / late competence protein ComC processing protease [Streptococcus parauberis KRS-02109]